jgi:hypothetical protein
MKPKHKFGEQRATWVPTQERVGLPKACCWRVVRVRDGELLGGSEQPAGAIRLAMALGGRKCGFRVTGPERRRHRQA